MTRGAELNNPMNVMENRTCWVGQVKPTTDPEGRLAQFIDMPHGIRAGAKIFFNYATLENLKTVRLMISRWAPPTENPTDDYIGFIASGLGVGPSDIIDLHNTNTMFKLCKLVIHFEQGSDVCADAEIAGGIALMAEAV